MPSYIEEPEAAACKWVSIREDNSEEYKLPDRILDPRLHASRDGLSARDLRRLAPHADAHRAPAAAVSAKWLARKDSKVLAIVGSGSVGEGTLATCDAVFAVDEVRIWSPVAGDARPLRRAPSSRHTRTSSRSDHRRTSSRPSRGADVVVTVTHARRYLVDGRLGRAGNAHRRTRRRPRRRAGARARTLLKRARVFVDDIRQCRDGRRDQRAAAARADHRGRHRRRDRQGDLRRESAAAHPTTRSRSSTRPASRCRTRRRFRSNTSARWRPASASRRR